MRHGLYRRCGLCRHQRIVHVDPTGACRKPGCPCGAWEPVPKRAEGANHSLPLFNDLVGVRIRFEPPPRRLELWSIDGVLLGEIGIDHFRIAPQAAESMPPRDAEPAT